MSLEQTIRETVMSESMDMDARLQQLVRAGLMPSNTLPLLRKSIAKVQGGMSLQGPERDVMATFINSMMYIVLGDDTIFNKARAGAKTYATEAKEKQEYDYEGDMAMSQLKSIIANSQRMHDMLSDDTNLPEWVQSKITLAEDYITTAANYMQGEMSEAVGDYTVKTVSPADAWKKHTGQKTSKSKVPVDPKTGKTLYQKVTSEEVEELDELSTATLQSYRKKARAQGNAIVDKMKMGAGDWSKDQKDTKTLRKRAAGAQASGKQLVKRGESLKTEEVEQVDELSRELVGRYARRAKDEADYGNPLKSRSKGRMMAQQKRWGGSSSYVKPARVPATEEVEQIDELSKKTLGNYVKKAAGHAAGSAAATAAIASSSNPKVPEKTKRDLRNRLTGISKATDKLTKEEDEKYAVSKTPPRMKPIAKPTMHHDAVKPQTSQSSVGTLARVRKGMAKRSNNGNVKEDIEAVKQMNESYKTAFDNALVQYNIKSPSELDESKRKEFFQFVDQEFKKGDQ